MDKTKLSFPVYIFYGLGVGYAIIDQIFVQWIIYFYLPPKNSGLTTIMPPVLLAIALMFSRFIDMVADPLVGYISDRIRTPFGRRIPFIAAGALPLALATIAFFYPTVTEKTSTSFVFLLITGGLFFVFYTIVAAPYSALLAEITHTTKERLNLSTAQAIFRLSFTGLTLIVSPILVGVFGKADKATGIRMMVIIFSIVAFLGMMVTVFFVSEKKLSGGKTSSHKFFKSMKYLFTNKTFIVYLFGLFFFFLGFNIIRSTINYYVEELMGYSTKFIFIATAVFFTMSALSFIPINKISQNTGYKKPMLVFLIIMIISSLLLFLVGKVLPPVTGFILFGIMGIPVAGGAFMYPLAMLSEIIAVSAKKNGVQIEGMFFGVQGFFLKMAFLFQITMLPLILVLGSKGAFLENIISTPEGVSRTGVSATCLVSAGCFVLSFLFYSLYKEEKDFD